MDEKQHSCSCTFTPCRPTKALSPSLITSPRVQPQVSAQPPPGRHDLLGRLQPHPGPKREARSQSSTRCHAHHNNATDQGRATPRLTPSVDSFPTSSQRDTAVAWSEIPGLDRRPPTVAASSIFFFSGPCFRITGDFDISPAGPHRRLCFSLPLFSGPVAREVGLWTAVHIPHPASQRPPSSHRQHPITLRVRILRFTIILLLIQQLHRPFLPLIDGSPSPNPGSSLATEGTRAKRQSIAFTLADTELAPCETGAAS